MSTSVKRPMTPEELVAANMVKDAQTQAFSFDRRAIGHIRNALTPPDGHVGEFVPEIGLKMVPQIWRMVWRYRRQIKHPERAKYLKMAEERMVPDYRTPTYRRIQEAQYKLDKLRREAAAQEEHA